MVIVVIVVLLLTGSLETASHYLMVLQRTQGSLVAHQHAVQLLEAVLQECDDDDDEIISSKDGNDGTLLLGRAHLCLLNLHLCR